MATQRNDCPPSEYSDKPGHSHNLISHHCPHEETLNPYTCSYPLSAQRRLLSDWMDAQADLSLRWVHRSFCLFCHVLAQMVFMNTCGEEIAILSFSLNYALLKHLTCQDLFTEVNMDLVDNDQCYITL